MKKLRLKALSLGAKEILNREQLKKINGGCSSDDDCSGGGYCQNGSCWANWGGSDTGSGGSGNHYATSNAPDETGCGTGTYGCSCNPGYLGCLPQGQCESTVYYGSS